MISAKILTTLLKLVLTIASIIFVFSQAYSYLALHLYGGTLLSSNSGPMLLRSYGLYVVFLAANGITECFMFAAMSKDEIDKHNLWMLLFSGIFVSTSWGFTMAVGSVGFIYANCVNMLVRTFRSVRFIRQFFGWSRGKKTNDATEEPSGAETFTISSFMNLTVYTVLGFSLACTLVSEHLLCCADGNLNIIAHAVVGLGCFTLVLATMYYTERDFFARVAMLVRGKIE